MSERKKLAYALWGLMTPEQKELIEEYDRVWIEEYDTVSEKACEVFKTDREEANRILDSFSTEEIENRFIQKAKEKGIMTEEQFEAFSLAYDIMRE